MSKRKNSPNKVSYRLGDEVNIREYPFHPFIPIDSISKKQKELYQVKNNNSVPVEKLVPLEKLIESKPYKDIPVEELPTFNLVKIGNPNLYRVDMKSHEVLTEDLKNLEARLENLKKEILNKDGIIYNQTSAINSNVQLLTNQYNTINANNYTIHEQNNAFNHNINTINHQTYYINSYNAEIARQQQEIESLNEQLTAAQTELEDIQLQVEGNMNQLTYHGTMLNAFNTVIQNPEYFTQLMSPYNMNPYTNYNNTL